VDDSWQIARQLADLWDLRKRPEFASYVLQTYGEQIDEPLSFRCIYIAEVYSGEERTGTVHGVIKEWWMANDDGIQRATRLSVELYGDNITPLIRFFSDNDIVVIQERIGHHFACGKVAHIERREGAVQLVNIKLKWNTASLRKKNWLLNP
jgi:hypothetical protein